MMGIKYHNSPRWIILDFMSIFMMNGVVVVRRVGVAGAEMRTNDHTCIVLFNICC